MRTWTNLPEETVLDLQAIEVMAGIPAVDEATRRITGQLSACLNELEAHLAAGCPLQQLGADITRVLAVDERLTRHLEASHDGVA